MPVLPFVGAASTKITFKFLVVEACFSLVHKIHDFRNVVRAAKNKFRQHRREQRNTIGALMIILTAIATSLMYFATRIQSAALPPPHQRSSPQHPDFLNSGKR
ncbi:hypothetical protein K461DRAFT_294050 [Myriangium duriaei CBS 260.36]|uniref:Uncharacterized protein n=1 Tax=Myriangium duriaei CBS 260.36 TaxID=1168546 RepID=A0A9P4J0Y1_9PEZI|nr:hypothetical protein K461DRAFT_294050 [Myriangium duriaei CBS 260.36]